MEFFLFIVEGDGVDEVLVGEEVEFIVIIRNVQGEVSYSEIDYVVVEVKLLMWGFIESRV